MEPFKFHTKYCQEDSATIQVLRYPNGEPGVQVWSQEQGCLATATVCLDVYAMYCQDGNVFIYGDYSEHVGVYQALLDAGVIGKSVRTVWYGGYDAHAFECPLLAPMPWKTSGAAEFYARGGGDSRGDGGF